MDSIIHYLGSLLFLWANSPFWVSRTVLEQKLRFSMDGKGRCIDNIFIERLWWSVKYEDVYIKNYENGWDLEDGLKAYFQKYNRHRRHSKIEHQYPYERYIKSIEK